MPLDFTTSPEGAFRRQGRFAGTLLSLNGWRGLTLGSAIETIDNAFESTLQEVVDNIYGAEESARSSLNGLARYLSRTAADALVQQVHADNPLPAQTLDYALPEFIAQMDDAGHTVLANTVSATVTADAGNQSDAQIIVSTLNQYGKTLENVFAEDIVVTCTQDSQNGATLGREPLRFEGEDPTSNQLAHDWPQGSGAGETLFAASADINAGSGHANHLTNSDWEDFATANTPDNWVLSGGVAGTDVFEETSIVYRGSSSLRLRGDGSTLVGVQQTLNLAAGSSRKLLPLTQYAFNCWVRMSSTPATGTLAVELIDGSSALVTDAAGANNRITKDLTGVSTTWVPVQGFFRTPAVLPDTYKVRIRQMVAVDAAKSVYVDDAVLVQARQLYPGGPFTAAFSGADKLIKDDKWTITVSTNAPEASWNRMFDRFFDMRERGLQLTAGSSPTIPATWISAV